MGYKTNSYGLRLGVNRSWKSKSFTIRRESLSFVFAHSEISKYLEDFFNKRYFHRRGILFSHLLTKPKGLKTLQLHIFVFDPSPLVHADQITELFQNKFLEEATELYVDKEEPVIQCFLRDFAFPHFWSRVNKIFFKGRRRVYRRLEAMFIHKISKAFPDIRLRARVIPIYRHLLNAEFHAKFLLMKFLYRRDVIQIVNPVAKRLLNRFSGYRVDCSGRFNRRQRASFYKFRKGPVPLNTFRARVDYYQVAFPLKYGACSIKVWLSNRKAAAPISGETRQFFFQGFNVHRFPKRRDIVSSTSADGEIALRKSWTPLRKFKSPFGKTKVKRMIPVENYRIIHPFSPQLYDRRLNLLKSLLSKSPSLPFESRRALVRLLLKPERRAPSWFRKAPALFRTPTRKELSEQVQKELDKVREDAPINREKLERSEELERRSRAYLATGLGRRAASRSPMRLSSKSSLRRLGSLRRLPEARRLFLSTHFLGLSPWANFLKKRVRRLKLSKVLGLRRRRLKKKRIIVDKNG